MGNKVMNHAEYQKKVKKMSIESLMFVIRDCQEAIVLQQGFNDNCGYYQDEIYYCGMELRARQQKTNRKAGV